MKIQVTPEHIKLGVPKSNTGCPIAHALRKQFPTAAIKVTMRLVWIDKSVYFLPLKAREFIVDFDDRRYPERPLPFELDLEPVLD